MSNELKECKPPVTFKIASNENVGVFFSHITINKKKAPGSFSSIHPQTSPAVIHVHTQSDPITRGRRHSTSLLSRALILLSGLGQSPPTTGYSHHPGAGILRERKLEVIGLNTAHVVWSCSIQGFHQQMKRVSKLFEKENETKMSGNSLNKLSHIWDNLRKQTSFAYFKFNYGKDMWIFYVWPLITGTPFSGDWTPLLVWIKVAHDPKDLV